MIACVVFQVARRHPPAGACCSKDQHQRRHQRRRKASSCRPRSRSRAMPPISAPAHYQAQRDPASTLPPAAQAKLTRLRTQEEDAGTLARELSERHRHAIDFRRTLVTRRDAAMRAGRGRSSPATSTLDDQISQTESEISALGARLDRARAGGSALPRRLTEYLRALPGGIPIEEHRGDPAPPKLARNESVTQAIEAARARLAELAADRHAVASAPIPSAQAKAAIRREIEGRAAAPDVLHTIEIGSGIGWPTELRQFQVGGVSGGHPVSGFASGQEIDTFGIFRLAQPRCIDHRGLKPRSTSCPTTARPSPMPTARPRSARSRPPRSRPSAESKV